MSSRILCAIAIGAMVVSAPAGSQARAVKLSRQIPVDKSFAEGELKWSDGFGAYKFLWNVGVFNGEIEICGVGYFTNIQSMSQSKDALRRAYIIYQDKKIMRDLRYFARVKRRSQLKTATANCRTTGVPAPKARFNVKLGWDAGRARF
ncbi:MAG TPA: hypothetical protein ENJ91_12885 [Rhodobacteraceae bacterium]|nr:hypothetical protein [Paracoccaceae bacterium]